MFSVCLRHAANDFSEYEYPVHFFFFDRFPWAVSLVVGNDKQLIFHLLQAFHVGRVVVYEGVDSITIEVLNTDIDKQQIAWLNGPGHAVTANIDDSDLLRLPAVEHPAGIFD